jgi:hypothetical protein
MAQAEPPAPRRNDLAEGLGWLVLGGAVLIGSVTMDRLQSQGVQPYAAPGLLPGLLGIALFLFGLLFTLRGRGSRPDAPRGQGTRSRRLVLVLALCLVFGVGLVGHGLPFWAASALFVTVSILVLQSTEQPGAGRLHPRQLATAALIGLGAGFGVTLLFQDLFLVRLP